MEEEILLERAIFEGSKLFIKQSDAIEFLTIECESDLGIDRGGGCFMF